MSGHIEVVESSGATGLMLSGELTFASVPELYARIPALLPKVLANANHAIRVDVSRVTRADSAGLVLLVGIRRGAVQSSGEIRFVGAPPKLVALASANKLDTILGLS